MRAMIVLKSKKKEIKIQTRCKGNIFEMVEILSSAHIPLYYGRSCIYIFIYEASDSHEEI